MIVNFLKTQLSENNGLITYKAEIFVRKKLSKPAKSRYQVCWTHQMVVVIELKKWWLDHNQ